MNYIAVFAAGVLIGGTGVYIYSNPVKTVSTLIDLYVDVKHYVMPRRGVPPRRSVTTVQPLNVFERNGYRFKVYRNFTVWERIDDGHVPHHGSDWALDRELQPFKVVRCDREMFNDDILKGLQQLAGPDGDFNGRVPTIDALNAYVGSNYSGPLVIENDNYEEFHIR